MSSVGMTFLNYIRCFGIDKNSGVILAGSQAWQEVVHQHTRSDEGSAAQPPLCQQSIASAQLASQAQNQAEPDHSTSAEFSTAGNAPQAGCMTP